ncbi:hypothetical protein BRCON_2414 [Candidatus Sumerlaea chitinivorans]|uniref:Uncharacterized protein n=1 Tax=Sumerlaea chitinivorans TaxID=2250252 RepID=A0A2Z4Y7H0_SUMC1|nr:hypothetical protein BRCON_2414 [Candidatus Sumerlaea chitinivorans]
MISRFFIPLFTQSRQASNFNTKCSFDLSEQAALVALEATALSWLGGTTPAKGYLILLHSTLCMGGQRLGSSRYK